MAPDPLDRRLREDDVNECGLSFDSTMSVQPILKEIIPDSSARRRRCDVSRPIVRMLVVLLISAAPPTLYLAPAIVATGACGVQPAPSDLATATVASKRCVRICAAVRSAASELRCASVTSR